MLIYLIKTTILLAVSLILYKLLLENTTMHKFKRFYLLATLVLSFIVPSISLSFASATTTVHETITQLSEVVVSKQNTTTNSSFNYRYLFYIVYGVGVLAMLGLFVQSLFHLFQLRSKGTLVSQNKCKVVLLSSIQTPFSFWKTIYAPLSLELSIEDSMYLHELEHIKQRHTWDILVIEILKIVFWFNPLLYVYKSYIALNHEFLADQKCLKSAGEANEYLQLLLKQTYLEQHNVLSSSFNFNLTKKRFIMITKKSNPIQNVFAIALASVLFCTVGVLNMTAQEKLRLAHTNSAVEINPNQVFTQVDEAAEFPGGLEAFIQEFVSKFEAPKELEEENVKAVIQFVVLKNGELDNFKVLKDPGYGIGDQAVRILQAMPSWKPGKVGGQVVNSQFVLPISIKLDKKKES